MSITSLRDFVSSNVWFPRIKEKGDMLLCKYRSHPNYKYYDQEFDDVPYHQNQYCNYREELICWKELLAGFKYEEKIEKCLNALSDNDPDFKRVIEDALGVCLFGKAKKIYVLVYGEKGTGKTAFLNMIKAVLTEKNFMSVKVKSFNNQHPSIFKDIKTNIVDDEDLINANTNTTFTNRAWEGLLAQSDNPDYNYGFCHSNRKRVFTKLWSISHNLIFSCRKPPYLGDCGEKIVQRCLPLKFTHVFKETDDWYLSYDDFADLLSSEDAINTLIYIALKGWIRVYGCKTFGKKGSYGGESDELRSCKKVQEAVQEISTSFHRLSRK